jgi:hypothetical protein
MEEDAEAPTWVIGFHAQQAVEKSLKAVLSGAGQVYPRTHNLVMLAQLLDEARIPMPPDAEEFGALTPFGVVLRYEDHGCRRASCNRYLSPGCDDLANARLGEGAVDRQIASTRSAWRGLSLARRAAGNDFSAEAVSGACPVSFRPSQIADIRPAPQYVST